MIQTKKLTVKLPFRVSFSEAAGEINALPGDTITVKDRGANDYYVLRVNDRPVYSTWSRKPWIDSHCESGPAEGPKWPLLQPKLQQFKNSIGQAFKLDLPGDTAALTKFDTIRQVSDDGTVTGDWLEANVMDCRLKQAQPAGFVNNSNQSKTDL